MTQWGKDVQVKRCTEGSYYCRARAQNTFERSSRCIIFRCRGPTNANVREPVTPTKGEKAKWLVGTGKSVQPGCWAEQKTRRPLPVLNKLHSIECFGVTAAMVKRLDQGAVMCLVILGVPCPNIIPAQQSGRRVNSIWGRCCYAYEILEGWCPSPPLPSRCRAKFVASTSRGLRHRHNPGRSFHLVSSKKNSGRKSSLKMSQSGAGDARSRRRSERLSYNNAEDIPMIADGPLSPYSALVTKLLVCDSWNVTFRKRSTTSSEQRQLELRVYGPTLATMLLPKNAAYPSPFSLYSE